MGSNEGRMPALEELQGAATEQGLKDARSDLCRTDFIACATSGKLAQVITGLPLCDRESPTAISGEQKQLYDLQHPDLYLPG